MTGPDPIFPTAVTPPPVPPTFHHVPVMLTEVVDLLRPVAPGWVVDGTVGGAGHAAALLEAARHVSVLGLDRDPDAVTAATTALARFGGRAQVRRARFDAMAGVADAAGAIPVVGVLLDLGVSSPQIDRPERGFSHRSSGPLDMRMDPTTGRSAAELVDTEDEAEIARLLRTYADERFARRIAAAVVAARPVTTTEQLANVVRNAIPAPARRTGGDPATRTFQALRIAVNAELDVLGPALGAALDLLAPGGRCVVLAYHSGEDRIVKDAFRTAATGGCTCPPGLPCACGARPTVRLLKRGAWKPSASEIEANRRASSARLRAVEKLGSPEAPAAERP